MKKVILFSIMLAVISTVFFGSFAHAETTYTTEPVGLVHCGGYGADGNPEYPCNFEFVIGTMENVIDFLLFTIAMPLAALAFMYAGFLYLTAGSNPGNVSKAKKIFWNVLWGLVIALAAWLAIYTLMTMLGVDPELIYLEG
ncbi:MAG: hypothetical protein H6791_01480 [Candidatus Nomurabacteria bacterium]|nr:MAG: hypothetical protein H6791_01480 [Candidatus Nomurabacteria bacterium]